MTDKKISPEKMCEAKRGFFTLYDCGKEARVRCKSCQRQLCLEHFPVKQSQCLECEAKSKQQVAFTNSGNYQKRQETVPHQDLLAAYHKRDKCLSDKDRKDIYLGRNLSDYYKAYDLRSFDVELSNIADLADSPDEVFFDS